MSADLFGTSSRGVWLTEVLQDAANSPRLTAWEEQFVRDLRRLLHTQGEHMKLTARQTEVIKRIEGKIYAAG